MKQHEVVLSPLFILFSPFTPSHVCMFVPLLRKLELATISVAELSVDRQV